MCSRYFGVMPVRVRNVSSKLFLSLTSRYLTSTANNEHYDIIIAGGGMVGSTLACTLGKNTKLDNKKILLLESNREHKWEMKDTYSKRVSALNMNTKNLLKKIGVWKRIEAGRLAPVKKLQVWDGISDVMITFNSEDMSEIVAYIVENNLLLSSVLTELKELPSVTVINEAKIKNYFLSQSKDNLNVVQLENGKQFSCDLLLGCDGASSKVRAAMGVHYLSWNYKQTGLVATLHLAEETDNVVAWQRFLPTGPIALLPLTDKLSSLVWTTTPEHAKQLVKMEPEHFVDAVNEAIWKDYKAPSVVREATKNFDDFFKLLKLPSNAIRQLPPTIRDFDRKSRAAFPLTFGHSANYVRKGVALVGDAAHQVHPLAGQGVNLGFSDVSTLNEILGETNYSGDFIGSYDCLKEYETERQKHNVPKMLAIDGLQRLYNTNFTPVVLMRSLGLQFTHVVNPLKKLIMEQATV